MKNKTNKKILITGGAGYIGSKLVNKLIAKGMSVVVIDNLSCGRKKNINDKAVFYNLDITSSEIFEVIKKEKPDVIFHLAASKSVNESLNNPMEFSKTNIVGSVNVINSAYRLGIKKLIFTSTAGVYGESSKGKKQNESDVLNPSSPYAWTKLAIEEYITYMNKYNNMECVVLRFANVYGPGGISEYKSVVNIFIEKLIKKETIKIHSNGSQTRDFVFIDDLIDVCESIIKTNFSKIKKSPIFNVSTGKDITISNLMNLISYFTQIVPNITYEKNIFSGQKNSILNPQKAKKMLKWKAQTSLKKGVIETISFYK